MDDESRLETDQLLVRVSRLAVILPVFLYDHSGLAMNTTGFHCPWDSGQVGFIYVSLEDVRSEYNMQRVSAKLRAKITEHLEQEVSTYSDYLAGRVFGYAVEKDDEEVESCWGFIGEYDGYCLEQARTCIRDLIAA